MDVCAKCGVIVEPGTTDSLRACEQKDGSLFCRVCDYEAFLNEVLSTIKRVVAVQPVQRRVA